jgi:hypothetical protein
MLHCLPQAENPAQNRAIILSGKILPESRWEPNAETL